MVGDARDGRQGRASEQTVRGDGFVRPVFLEGHGSPVQPRRLLVTGRFEMSWRVLAGSRGRDIFSPVPVEGHIFSTADERGCFWLPRRSGVRSG